MAFRRNVSQRPSRSSRRPTDWGVGPAVANQAIASSGKLLWTTGIVVTASKRTLVRTRGLVTSMLLTAGTPSAGYFGAHGIYMMTEDAFAVGVTAALDPLVDSSSDMWIWHSFFHVAGITATIADGVNAVGAFSRIIIDSKAMRKDFDADRVMVGVTGVTEIGAATMNVNGDTRQLLMA